ncbi:MAG: ribonuclease H-like domain-containing protein [Armatimonadota bacterium]
MSREQLKRRVAKLSEEGQQEAGEAEGEGAGKEVVPAEEAEASDKRILAGLALKLEACLPGEVAGNDLGSLYVVRRREAEVSGYASPLPGLLETLGRTDLAALHEEFGLLAGADAEAVAFLDTETAGLQSVPLFLCGIMRCRHGELWIEQMLARDYTEEPALLQYIHDSLSQAQVLVTYNGRTFDVPFIHDRMAYHLIEARIETAHLDLLPHARRRFRGVLPDCKLQTLETQLCRRPRSAADIPGEQIPEAYHDFVADGDARRLEPIFEHNALDLVTLAEVLVRLVEV